jgi:hypothetical protein
MMCKGSEEGNLTGLSWFDAEVKKFNFDQITCEYRIWDGIM